MRFIYSFLFLFATTAEAAEPILCASTTQMSQAFVKSSTRQKPPRVQLTLEGDVLRAQFVIDTSGTTMNAKKLSPGEYPYQFDVVEVFVGVRGAPYPYYEFELSPYNENFQVLIEWKNGKKVMTNAVDMNIETSAVISGASWTAEIKIPLKNLGWDGHPENIIGNAFAVLGKGGTRSYWSLNLPEQVKPNFHKPEHFCHFLELQ